jgi:hypothetical protein
MFKKKQNLDELLLVNKRGLNMIKRCICYFFKNPEVATSVGATLVAFIALVTSVIALFIQRRHYRLSLKPIGFIKIGNYEDDIYVKIINFGTGPLIIEKLVIEYETQKYNTLISLVKDKIDISVYRDFVEKIDGRTIPSNGEIVLLRFQDQDSDLNTTNLRSVLSKTIITIEYRDIYGKKMQPYKRDLIEFKDMLY